MRATITRYNARVDDPNTLLLHSFDAGDDDVYAVRVQWAIYVPPPFVSIMMTGDLTPMQDCTILRAAIIFAGKQVDCHALVNWLRVALVPRAVDQRLTLLPQDPTSPLYDANLLLHRYRLLIQNLNGIKLELAHTQDTLIAANIGDLVFKHCE